MTRFIAPLVAALATVIGLALQLAWLPRLPAEVAIHWGPSGAADGFGPAWTTPLLAAVLGIGMTMLAGYLGGSRIRTRRGGSAAPSAGILAGAAVLLAVLTTGSFAIQLDGVTGPIGPVLAIGAAAGVVVAVPLVLVGRAAARALAAESSSAAGAATARTSAAGIVPLPLHPGERAVWIGRAAFATGPLVALAASMVVFVGVFAYLAATRGFWALVVVAVLVAVATIAMLDWQVRVDGDGLRIRSAWGLPRFRVPLAGIRAVEVVEVTPMQDFGGWGLRMRAGALGIVTRPGPALSVERTKRRRLVVTVDDAATAAALLEALRESGAAA